MSRFHGGNLNINERRQEMQPKRMISMKEARLPRPGKETWGARKQGNPENFKRAIELLHDEQCRNPNHTVSMNVNHELGQVTFS